MEAGFLPVKCQSKGADVHPATNSCEQQEALEATMAPGQKEKGERTVCSSNDYYILLEYLEDESNYEKLFGSGKKTLVGGRMRTRTAIWEIAASEVRALGFQKTNGANLYKKWNRYYTKYREAKAFEAQSGGGLTQEELDKGMTMEQKLNQMCDHYLKIDALMAHRLNVKPPAISGPMGFDKVSVHKDPPANVIDLSSPTQDCLYSDADVFASEGPAADGQQTNDDTQWVEQEIVGDVEHEPDMASESEAMAASEREAMLSNATATETGIDNATASSEAHQGAAISEPQAQGRCSGTARKSPAPSKSKRPAEQDIHRPTKAPPTGPAVKPSLASVFQESKVQEAQSRLCYMEKKENWKMAEVRDRQEARADDLKKKKLELDFEGDQRKVEREEKVSESLKARQHSMLEAKVQRKHVGQMGRQNNKLQIILAGWSQNKTQQEIAEMCALMDA